VTVSGDQLSFLLNVATVKMLPLRAFVADFSNL
jgi:hypothetical protein